MRIAVDAMGGDFAPREVVAGTVQAAKSLDAVEKIFLVGDQEAIERELDMLGERHSKIEIVHTSEVIGMDETPVAALRKKKDSSISRAVDMVKRGEADGFFSAGNTGAVVAASQLKLRTLEGVWRPAIATVIPTPVKPFLLLDAGATPDCSSDLLYQFSLMGSVYSREILNVARPAVGLLSIGEEAAKGNANTKEAFQLMSQSKKINFVGNVESSDMFAGSVDVVVCDGFVGNVVLKTSESVAKALGHWVKDEIKTSPLAMVGALLAKRVFVNMKRRADPAQYGGAPLLGVNGAVIIGHGSSSQVAILNGIRTACTWVGHDINHLIVELVQTPV
ncbi:MAG: phosphate acyltransferase PlsX [Spartobacteria bacterium]|nr:phosphate acyltransferase PlsX [Spartobacteria bacterium]